jgi:hypothetical protein
LFVFVLITKDNKGKLTVYVAKSQATIKKNHNDYSLFKLSKENNNVFFFLEEEKVELNILISKNIIAISVCVFMQDFKSSILPGMD